MHFLVNGEGKYELHLTMRTWKAEKIPVKSLAGILSNLTGRRLIPGKEGAQLIERIIQQWSSEKDHPITQCPE